MNDLISVIIPVYNNERYLSKCLMSVCSNTYKALEIILIDDGSSDKSGVICDKMAKSDSRIHVIHQKNSGVSQSRNNGIACMQGKYVAFVDSDDYVDNDYFEKLLFLLKSEEADLALGSVAHVYGNKVENVCLEECNINLENPCKRDGKDFYELNSSYYLYGPVNKLYKADIIKKNFLQFPRDTFYGEDLLFNFKYLRCCKRISYRREPVYYYNHDNEQSLSHRYRENLFENGLRLNNEIKNFCQLNGFWDDKMKKYVFSRIFDDAYNSLFSIWSKQCTLSLKEKYKRTKMIMNHLDVREALRVNEYTNYSSLYLLMIKKRSSLIFGIVCSISLRI